MRIVEVGGDSYNSIGNDRTQVGLCRLLHLGQYHGGDLFGGKGLRLAFVLHLNLRTATFVGDGEGPVLHVGLDSGVVEPSSDHPLGVKHRIVGVHGHLVLGGISDEPFVIGESDVARSGTVTLVVGNDLHLAVLENANAGVGRSEVNSNCRCMPSILTFRLRSSNTE